MTMDEAYKGFTISILQDAFPANPRTEWENIGTMICSHPRYELGDEKGVSGSDIIDRLFEDWGERILRPEIATALPLVLLANLYLLPPAAHHPPISHGFHLEREEKHAWVAEISEFVTFNSFE